MGHIFHYILKTRDFQRDYFGRYKDEKAYFYFDSGFVDEILLHISDVAIKIVFCKVRASMTVSNFKELWVEIQDTILFESFEGLGISKKYNANIIEIANEIIYKKKAKDEKITEFLQKLVIGVKESNLLEKRARRQANNSAWKELRKGRITTSVYQDVYTKVSNIVKKRKSPFQKTTSFVAKVINRDKDLSNYLLLPRVLKMK